MTKQQLEIIKVLSDKYRLSETGVDYTLLLLGVGYGLSQEEIEQYLSLGENQLLKKHLQMVCMIIGIPKSDMDVDVDKDEKKKNEILQPKEQLIQLLWKYYHPDTAEGSYEKLAEYILQDKELSAAQIE